MPNLFFIQSKSDIDFINSKIKTNRKDLYISCNHIAYYECQKKNIHTIPFENYLDRDSFVKNRPDFIYHRNQWIDQFDCFLKNNIPEFNKANFCPTRYSILGMYGLLDEIEYVFNIMTNILDSINCKKIYIAKNNGFKFGTWSRIVPQTSMLSSCIKEISLKNNIEISYIGHGENIVTTPKSINCLDSIKLYIKPNHKRALKLLFQYGIKFFIKYLFFKLFSKKKVLFIGGAYDLMGLIKIFVNKKYNVKISEFPEYDFVDLNESQKIEKKISNILLKLEEETFIRKPFNDYDYRIPEEILFEVINRFLINIVPKMWGSYCCFDKSMDIKDYSMIFFWAFGEGVYPALSMAVKNKAPTAIYQHGGGSRNIWLTDYFQEATMADYYLSYGDGINETFQKIDNFINNKNYILANCASIGALRVSQINKNKNISIINKYRDNIKENLGVEKLILYVPNVYQYPGSYISDSIMHGIEYFKFQQKMLNIFHSNKENHGLIYKGFKTDLDIMVGAPIKNYIKDMKMESVYYTSSIPLTDLIFVADKIVIDHNQTALNEIFQAQKETLVFDQGENFFWNIHHEARYLINENAHLALTTHEFFQKFKDLLHENLNRKNINFNSKYFEKYSYFDIHEEDYENKIYNKISCLMKNE